MKKRLTGTSPRPCSFNSPTVTEEGQAQSVLIRLGNWDSHGDESLKLVTSDKVRIFLFYLQSTFSTPVADEGLEVLLNEASVCTEPESHRSTKRRQ